MSTPLKATVNLLWKAQFTLPLYRENYLGHVLRDPAAHSYISLFRCFQLYRHDLTPLLSPSPTNTFYQPRLCCRTGSKHPAYSFTCTKPGRRNAPTPGLRDGLHGTYSCNYGAMRLARMRRLRLDWSRLSGDSLLQAGLHLGAAILQHSTSRIASNGRYSVNRRLPGHDKLGIPFCSWPSPAPRRCKLAVTSVIHLTISGCENLRVCNTALSSHANAIAHVFPLTALQRRYDLDVIFCKVPRILCVLVLRRLSAAPY